MSTSKRRPRQRGPFKCGFVSIIGLPNAGKSTLLNALLGQKLAIVAPKPQTTRTVVQGVLSIPGAQIVFLDTPGIHESDSLINKRMMQIVRGAAEERDLLLYVTDATHAPGPEDQRAVDFAKKSGAPVFAILNKVDRLRDKGVLFDRIHQYQALHPFAEFIPVSALKGDGIEDLKRSIVKVLPEGAAVFPPDYLTDQPERFLAAELIREKILRHTHQEVPHAIAVVIERWEETAALTRISATVFVERAGQKAIVIGKGGEMLKRTGTAARKDIEELLGRKVFLELFVKVKERWREDAAFLNEIDWRAMAGE
jgi:GTP-binding protein Era